MKVLNIWKATYKWRFTSTSGSQSYDKDKENTALFLTDGDSLGDVIKAIDVQVKWDSCGNKAMLIGLVGAEWLGTAISP